MKRRTYPASLIILALAGAIALVFIAALIAFAVAADGQFSVVCKRVYIPVVVR